MNSPQKTDFLIDSNVPGLTRGALAKRLVLIAGGWIVIASAFSGLLYSTSNQLNPARPVGWKNVVLWQVIIYGWAVLFPLIVFVAVRVRFERFNWWKILPVHVFAAAIFILLHSSIFVLVHSLIEPELFAANFSFSRSIGQLFVRNWTLDLLMYSFILSSVYVVDYYRRFQAEQLKSSELKGALADSELQALKMQLHPHFLFNTLNTISALMHEDVAAADRMVARLGDFLRGTLEDSGDREVSLSKEMEFIDRYLEIETIRFGDRLSIFREIDPNALDACVPNLILQPIIENAMRHGISRAGADGCLLIRALRIGQRLRIEVEDNGPGPRSYIRSGCPTGSGIGVANTRARLRNMFGSDFRFELGTAFPCGTITTVDIPYRTTAKHSINQSRGFSNGRTSNQSVDRR